VGVGKQGEGRPRLDYLGEARPKPVGWSSRAARSADDGMTAVSAAGSSAR
jgi:hypothetical protein